MKNFWLPLVIFVFALSGARFVNGSELVVGYYDWCPYTCDPKINDGKKGYLVEVIEEVFKGTEFKLRLKLMPYARILAELERGNVHLVSGATKEESLTFLNPNLNQGYYSGGFFARSDQAAYKGYESLSKLKKVAIIKGYEYNSPEFSRLKQDSPKSIKYMTGDDLYKKMFKLLELGRIDAIHEDIKALTYYADKYGVSDSSVYWGGKTQNAQIFISFSPASDIAKKAFDVFNTKFQSMVNSKKIDDILKRYDIDPAEFNYSDR